MSDLTDAMLMHIHHIIHEEHRPFSYLDFIRFEVDGQEYKMTHGTFRNYISRLTREGLSEISYRSNVAFYSLRGVKFNKASRTAMTGNHTGVSSSSTSVSPSVSSLSSNPLYRTIRNLPLGKSSVHDIHLRFASPRIYATISSLISEKALDYGYTVNTRSLDILLPAWTMSDLLVKATIHRTDVVSVVVGCSLNPVSLDFNGIIRLTNALSIVEDRLSQIVGKSHTAIGSIVEVEANKNSPNDQGRRAGIIPPHSQWTVTMWHFGADASVEYAGEKFSVTWETAESVLVRAYTKVMGDTRTRIRLERQEYPKTTLADLIEQKINRNSEYGG